MRKGRKLMLNSCEEDFNWKTQLVWQKCVREKRKISQIRAFLSSWGLGSSLSTCMDFLASALVFPYPLEHWVEPRWSWKPRMSYPSSRPDWTKKSVATHNSIFTWKTEVFSGFFYFFIFFYSSLAKEPGRLLESSIGSGPPIWAAVDTHAQLGEWEERCSHSFGCLFAGGRGGGGRMFGNCSWIRWLCFIFVDYSSVFAEPSRESSLLI